MWEKTLMSNTQRQKIVKSIDTSQFKVVVEGLVARENKLLEAQAEITGKIAEQEGIKKVVEWVEEHRHGLGSELDDKWDEAWKEWQNFKKEVGL